MFKDKKETMLFKMPKEGQEQVVDVMKKVYAALKEKDYEPKNQIIGYILSGDPSYITSHSDARKIIRHDLMEELLTYYLVNNNIGQE